MPTKLIIAIDPGPAQSAGLVFAGQCPGDRVIGWNAEVVAWLKSLRHADATLFVEFPQCMGMAAGEELFKTAYWAGRFGEAWGTRHELVKRIDVKLHLCGTARAKDPNVRQALLDRFGGKAAAGTKAEPGPLYGIKSHLWAALAVAVWAWDCGGTEPKR